MEKTFKDYNGQTYWASVNLNRIHKAVRPKWFSIAFGMGADGMVYAGERNSFFNGQYYKANRQYYVSVDVDWEQIKTKKMWLQWVFRVANCIKIPAPTLQFENGKPIKFRALGF